MARLKEAVFLLFVAICASLSANECILKSKQYVCRMLPYLNITYFGYCHWALAKACPDSVLPTTNRSSEHQKKKGTLGVEVKGGYGESDGYRFHCSKMA